MVSAFICFAVVAMRSVMVHLQFRVNTILVSHVIIFVESFESHDLKVRSLGRGDEHVLSNYVAWIRFTDSAYV